MSERPRPRRGTQRNDRPPMSSLHDVVSGLERAMSQSLAYSWATLNPPAGWSTGVGAERHRSPAKTRVAILVAGDGTITRPGRGLSSSPRSDETDTDDESCCEVSTMGLDAWRDKLVRDLREARDQDAAVEELQQAEAKLKGELDDLRLLQKNRHLQRQLNRKLQKIREVKQQRADEDLDEGFQELMDSHVELKGARHAESPARVRSQAKILEGEFMQSLQVPEVAEQPPSSSLSSWFEPPRPEFTPAEGGRSLPWYQELTRGFPSLSSLVGPLQPRGGDIKGLATVTGSLVETPSAINEALALALRHVLTAVGTSVPSVEVWNSQADAPGTRGGKAAAVGDGQAVPLAFEVTSADPKSIAPMLRLLEQEASCGGARELLPALAELLVSSGRISMSLVVTKWRPVSWVAA